MTWTDGITSESASWTETFADEGSFSAFGDGSIAVFSDSSYTAYGNSISEAETRTEQITSESSTRATALS